MPRLSRSRILTLLTVPLLGAAVTVGVALSSTANAATTGFTYAVGISTGTQAYGLTNLQGAIRENNPLLVSKSMTADEAQRATTALGGTPKVGFQVTKVFDNSDHAARIDSLVQTAVVNAGLWTYYNGKLCDHIQARPAYVASVDHPLQTVDSAGSVTETIQFVGKSFIQIVPDTCPGQSIATTTGVHWTGSISKSGGVYSFLAIKSLTWSQSETTTVGTMTTQEQNTYQHQAGASPVQSITMTKSLDSSDKKLDLASYAGLLMNSTTFSISQYKGSALQYTITLTNPMVSGYTVASDASGPIVTLSIAFSTAAITYGASPLGS